MNLFHILQLKIGNSQNLFRLGANQVHFNDRIMGTWNGRCLFRKIFDLLWWMFRNKMFSAENPLDQCLEFSEKTGAKTFLNDLKFIPRWSRQDSFLRHLFRTGRSKRYLIMNYLSFIIIELNAKELEKEESSVGSKVMRNKWNAVRSLLRGFNLNIVKFENFW